MAGQTSGAGQGHLPSHRTSWKRINCIIIFKFSKCMIRLLDQTLELVWQWKIKNTRDDKESILISVCVRVDLSNYVVTSNTLHIIHTYTVHMYFMIVVINMWAYQRIQNQTLFSQFAKHRLLYVCPSTPQTGWKFNGQMHCSPWPSPHGQRPSHSTLWKGTFRKTHHSKG